MVGGGGASPPIAEKADASLQAEDRVAALTTN